MAEVHSRTAGGTAAAAVCRFGARPPRTSLGSRRRRCAPRARLGLGSGWGGGLRAAGAERHGADADGRPCGSSTSAGSRPWSAIGPCQLPVQVGRPAWTLSSAADALAASVARGGLSVADAAARLGCEARRSGGAWQVLTVAPLRPSRPRRWTPTRKASAVRSARA
eukprot:SAG31_NODE_422_length_15859_cov_5.161865_7_plen_166_part_00